MKFLNQGKSNEKGIMTLSEEFLSNVDIDICEVNLQLSVYNYNFRKVDKNSIKNIAAYNINEIRNVFSAIILELLRIFNVKLVCRTVKTVSNADGNTAYHIKGDVLSRIIKPLAGFFYDFAERRMICSIHKVVDIGYTLFKSVEMNACNFTSGLGSYLGLSGHSAKKNIIQTKSFNNAEFGGNIMTTYGVVCDNTRFYGIQKHFLIRLTGDLIDDNRDTFNFYSVGPYRR